MTVQYLLSEDGFHLLLEDDSGALILEQDAPVPPFNPGWNPVKNPHHNQYYLRRVFSGWKGDYRNK